MILGSQNSQLYNMLCYIVIMLCYVTLQVEETCFYDLKIQGCLSVLYKEELH